MNGLFRHVRGDKTLFYSLLLGLALLLGSAVFIIVIYRFLPPLIPVFNQLPWGDGRLAQKQFIFTPIILVLFFAITNLTLSLFIYKKIPLLSRILLATLFIGALLVFIFIIRLAQIII
ncbi:hypothetical protein M1615_05060 [Patescibacteria group bacterium]|nr:hypothetical protein [Patescibacteria group bacterium]MCL5010057.1 hypothetical protein [Patescibacteria group bacterium]